MPKHYTVVIFYLNNKLKNLHGILRVFMYGLCRLTVKVLKSSTIFRFRPWNLLHVHRTI